MHSLLLVFLFLPFSCAGSDSNPSVDKDLFSLPPAWARDAVWYQIFPERFRNGDPRNDPTIADIKGAWPHQVPQDWNISSWTSDWFKLQPWEVREGRGFYYSVQQRRYGGDIQGVLDRLDYLQNLGITAVYFNPLFQSPSLHKYDASMYHHIDRNFGPDPEGDAAIMRAENPADPASWRWTSADTLFLRLVREIHRRGMKVIIDGVFNHVGTTFWAFRDLVQNQERSPYRDWFVVNSWDNPSTPADEFDYKGWEGIKDLPIFRQDANGAVSGPREHIQAIVRRWMDPDGDGNPTDGIDGWRLDVAEKVALPFWNVFRRWVRGINPDAYITGEVWWKNWAAGEMYNAATWLRGDAFDAVMNYRVAREACHFFKDREKKISAEEFDRRLAGIRGDYRPETDFVLMNLLDSHDTDRLSSMIVNVDNDYDHHAGTSDNRNYDVRKPNAAELRIQRLMVLFQMTYVGAPMVYYGDEAGMWGGDDPDERKPMLWDDMKFDVEASHPFGLQRPADENVFNQELFRYYRSVISLRRSLPALARGDFHTVIADSGMEVFGYARSTDSTQVLVLLNNDDAAHSISLGKLNLSGGSPWTSEFISEQGTTFDGKTLVALAPKSGMVLERQIP